MCCAPLGVVPILIGPLQVLLAMLPALLLGLAGGLLALFRPATLKLGAKLLWRNKLALAAVVAGVLVLAYVLGLAVAGRGPSAGGALTGADWPAARGGPDRRGFAGGAEPTAGGVLWTSAPEAKTVYASPAVVGNRVYITSAEKSVFSDRGGVFCLDADNGALVWKYSPADFRATFSSPVVAAGLVVVGEGLHDTPDARITCLRADTGAPVWQFRTASHVESTPCVAQGRVFVGAGDDGVYCLGLAGRSGQAEVLWHLEGKEYPDCEAAPVAHDGQVYFALGEDGCGVVCVRADDGRRLWRTPTPYPVFSSPTTADGRVFVGMGNGNMVEPAEVVRENTLRRLRQQGAGEAALAEAGKRLSPAGEVWCLDARTGAALWKHKLPQTVLGAIALAEGRLYFGSRDGVFHCLTVDGQVVFERDVHEPIIAAAAAGQEHVYFLTESGALLGLDRLTNRLVWQARLGAGGPFFSSPTVARGHVYVGTAGAGLLCLGAPGGRAHLWSGALGGPGQSGWADGSPLPPAAEFAWRWPGEDETQPPVIRAPAAYRFGALYVGVASKARTGLAKLSIDRRAAAAAEGQEGPREQWFRPTPLSPCGSAAVGDERAYVVTGKPGQSGRELLCLDAENGKEIWKLPVEPTASGEILLTGQGLYAFVKTGALSGIAVEGDRAGQEAWSLPVADALGPPAQSAGTIVVTAPSRVLAIDSATRQVRWEARLPRPATVPAVCSEDVVLVGSGEELSALSMVNGAALWSVRCGAVASAIVFDEQGIAFATRDGQIVVLDWLGRELRRIAQTDATLPPMLCGGQLLHVAADGSFRRVDLSDGKEDWFLATEFCGRPLAGAVLVESRLYFPSAKGLISAAPAR